MGVDVVDVPRAGITNIETFSLLETNMCMFIWTNVVRRVVLLLFVTELVYKRVDLDDFKRVHKSAYTAGIQLGLEGEMGLVAVKTKIAGCRHTGMDRGRHWSPNSVPQFQIDFFQAAKSHSVGISYFFGTNASKNTQTPAESPSAGLAVVLGAAGKTIGSRVGPLASRPVAFQLLVVAGFLDRSISHGFSRVSILYTERLQSREELICV